MARPLPGPGPAPALIVMLARVGREWAATSPDLIEFRAWGTTREAAEQAARDELGPAVRLEFRVLGP